MHNNNSIHIITNLANVYTNDTQCPLAVLHSKVDSLCSITYANQLFYDTLGYNKEELENILENSFLQLLTNESKKIFLDALAANKPDTNFTISLSLQKKNNIYSSFILAGKFYNYNAELHLQSYLVDISEQENLLTSLSATKTYSEILYSFNIDTYIDYDIHNKTLRISPSFAQKYSLNEVVENYPKSLIDQGVIKEDILLIDQVLMPYIADLAKYIVSGNEKDLNSDILHQIDKLRFEDLDSHYATFYDTNKVQSKFIVYSKLIFNQDNIPVRIIGKLNDITKQQAQIDMLKVKAEKDLLTGLYNKITTEILASQLFENSDPMQDQYILMIIDADNFKDVNDVHGHLFGDILLAQLSDHLKEIFRSEDLIGRLGGDEFIVVMKNFSTFNFLHRKAKSVCHAFNKTFDTENKKINISASIGIAYYPIHGTDFTTLYQNADKALYSAKAKGKNSYVIYDEGTIHPNALPARTEIDNAGQAQKSFRANRLEYIFKLLYSSDNLENTIQTVLKLLISDFSFTRGYIIEANKEVTYFSKTFEHNIYPEEHFINDWQNMPLSDFASVYGTLLENQRILFKTIEEAPIEFQNVMRQYKVKSTMIFHVLDKDKPYGAIGFDNTKTTSNLSDNQIDELSILCELLGTFLIKERKMEKIIELEKGLN